MLFSVVDSFAAPSTGTFFIYLISKENRKMILWCDLATRLQPGECINIVGRKAYLNNTQQDIAAIALLPPVIGMWKTLQKSTECPGNASGRPELCPHSARCLFKKCPYGIPGVKQHDSVS